MERQMEDVPPFFLCPISLQVMEDPVTISTGMTFERDSIQRWFFSYKKTTCPITMQRLCDFHLTPNSNLERLIRSWQSQHPLKPQPDIDVDLLLKELQLPHVHVRSLRAVRSAFEASTHDHTTVDDFFAVIALLVSDNTEERDDNDEALGFLDEAMSVLCLLKPSNEAIEFVYQYENNAFPKSLCSIITSYPSLQAKIRAAVLLKLMLTSLDYYFKVGLGFDFFESLSEILKDENSAAGSSAVLHILMEVVPFEKNTEKAVKSGIVPVLVELVAEGDKRRKIYEMMVVVLEKLCRKAEGREAFVAHPAAMASVLSKILRVSQLVNDKAVSLFMLLFRFCKRNDVVSQFMEVGGAAKLWALLQSGCCFQTKKKATEILRFHLKDWSKNPCFPSAFRPNFYLT